MVVMTPCENCEATIPKGIGIATPDGERMTAATNYCPICGTQTPWGEKYEQE